MHQLKDPVLQNYCQKMKKKNPTEQLTGVVIRWMALLISSTANCIL